MAVSKARAAWDELNERQRIYLEVIYDEDQGLEAERGIEAARGRWSSAPARVWRRVWVAGQYASAPARLRRLGVWEEGAGSTLGALADRGLIGYGDGWVLLTRAGRAAVRAGLGIVPWRKPQWALSEWLWRQMVKVVAAGPAGLPTSELWGTAHMYLQEGYGHEPGNRPYLRVDVAWVRYERRDWQHRPYDPPQYGCRDVRRYVLTDAGRAHYAEHLSEYREMYDDIDAPDLPSAPADEPGEG